MFFRPSSMPMVALLLLAAACGSDSDVEGVPVTLLPATMANTPAPTTSAPVDQIPSQPTASPAPTSAPAPTADPQVSPPTNPEASPVPPQPVTPENPMPTVNQPMEPTPEPVDLGMGEMLQPVEPMDPGMGEMPQPTPEPVQPAAASPKCLNDWSALGKGMAVNVCFRAADGKGYCSENGMSFSAKDRFYSNAEFPQIINIAPFDFSDAHCIVSDVGDVFCGNAGGYQDQSTVAGKAAFVTGGINTRCAVIQGATDGVQCWEQNSPAEDVGLPAGRVLSLSAGYNYACAVVGAAANATDGDVYCWGSGGSAVFLGSDTPVKVDQLSPAKEVGAGHSLLCARGVDDALTCLTEGGGDYQEVQVTQTGVVSLGPGQNSNCFAKVDGTVICTDRFGGNAADVPGMTGALVARGSRSGFGCALNGNDELYCWSQGQSATRVDVPSAPEASPCTP